MATTGKKTLKLENLTWKRRVAGILELILGCYALYVAIMAFIHLQTATDAQEELGYIITSYPMAILGTILTSGGILALFRRGFLLAVSGLIILNLMGLGLLISILTNLTDLSSSDVIPVIVIPGVIFGISILATILLIQSNRDFN